EDQQDLFLVQVREELHFLVHRSLKGKVQRHGNGRHQQLSRKQGSERHKIDFPRKLFQLCLCDLEGQIGFADASWTRDGHQSHLLLLEERGDLCHFLLTANQRGRKCGKMVRQKGDRSGGVEERRTRYACTRLFEEEST